MSNNDTQKCYISEIMDLFSGMEMNLAFGQQEN